MRSEPKLEYPLFLIERNHSHEFTGYAVIRNRFDFIAFGRVANSAKYSVGYIFDSAGHRYNYEVAAGWPGFNLKMCKILDNLVVPGLASKVAEILIYFGPRTVSSDEPDLEHFKSAIISSVEEHERQSQDQLRELVGNKGSFRGVIEAIEWWT